MDFSPVSASSLMGQYTTTKDLTGMHVCSPWICMSRVDHNWTEKHSITPLKRRRTLKGFSIADRVFDSLWKALKSFEMVL